MYLDKIKSGLDYLNQHDLTDLLSDSLTGVEKETLRVSPQGGLAQTPHPVVLGSALTHPYITTDYSEALLEFITPPLNSIKTVIRFLEELHQFVYKRLDGEILWATSMPCVVAGESSIPIAQYGTSNIGRMKNIYRVGLGHRYGKIMQVIAGVHFNYSYSDSFWDGLYEVSTKDRSRQDFVSDRYFSMIRNLLRIGWMVPYLFGASPAICKSFLKGIPTTLKEFNANTYYQPYATSLRMSDIGYQNNKENENGIKACYDSLDEYIANLRYAIETPCRQYEQIGVKVNNEYRQLNANILQIENEYYSTVRPKQILNGNEKPTHALKERGVRYIELRSIDVNAYDPFGVNQEQLYFLEALMLFCLLNDSPYINPVEREEIDNNEMLVALRGREPGLHLERNGDKIGLKHWSMEIFNALEPIGEVLDRVKQSPLYSQSIRNLRKLVEDPEKTPSARMLAEMSDNQEGFYAFARRKSISYNQYFNRLVISKEREEALRKVTVSSLQKLEEIEATDTLDFDVFLSNYFAQA